MAPSNQGLAPRRLYPEIRKPSHVLLHCNIRGLPGFTQQVSHALRVLLLFPQLVWRLDPPETDSTRLPPTEGDNDEDGAVFTRAASGDERAWQELFTRWKKPLLAFFYRSLNSMPEAEDLTLEVFVRLHRASARYEARGHLFDAPGSDVHDGLDRP